MYCGKQIWSKKIQYEWTLKCKDESTEMTKIGLWEEEETICSIIRTTIFASGWNYDEHPMYTG